ncbi:Two component system histidine kinase [Desulfonema magnum]|uniref:histidine kinase n=2 Tax=Desulfonema magnum TaxID=45655 RepID=A0A975GSS8_9BACT|nr:Two component system histidine kinase [Desulfonema magnum]
MNFNSDFYQKLKWLMFFRVIFTTLLLGSTIILQLNETSSPLDESLLALYGLIAGIFILSFCYTMILKFFLDPEAPPPSGREPGTRKKKLTLPLFTYIQISIDTFVVSLIIFMTGSFSSVFSFLYLVVIIYASILLFRKGSMVMAALSSIQYGAMIDLEFYGILKPFGMERNLIIVEYNMSHVFYKITMTMVACFAVAFLSSLLSEQTKKSKKELLDMEAHVKRVEKMAAVGEMAAGLAHEIKNPLASLRGSVQLLQDDIPYDSERDKLMHIVLREADRLNSLVSDFLLFAKPPAGRVEIFDLGDALTETVSLFEKDTNCCERISIVKEIFSGVRVEMDPAHLRQILWNLLLNAAEAIEDNGLISIKMYLSKEYADISIADTGCGMSDEVLKTIFDPFVTKKNSGTGLGLSIVHRIVESCDGRLDVESEVGRGTTFTLKLKRPGSV